MRARAGFTSDSARARIVAADTHRLFRSVKPFLAAAFWCLFVTCRVGAADKAPPDIPVGLAAEELKKFDAATQPYIAQARATYPQAKQRFQEGLGPGNVFYVSTKIGDAHGKREQVFVRIDRIDGDRLVGHVASKVLLVDGVRQNDAYELHEPELIDWTITRPDGSEEGNYVGKFLDAYNLVEFGCSLMLDENGTRKFVATPDLHILGYDDRIQLVRFESDPGSHVKAVLCNRSSVIPGKNDYQVILAQVPLYLKSTRQAAVLEFSQSKYQLRLLQGDPFTTDEQRMLEERLNAFPLERPNAVPAVGGAVKPGP